ncbi:hypothetical protein FJT64_008002 [Amphibalanus amphitrite]|uniref:Uncharacterized protein n=1 Tax=Amphibalanus amphitrite TaxID=1232801 RepID=A0A6A4VKX9_AMPAM|nr:hypothetical protein FJT64_008002 [Amphibalanus amphitrite]
MGTARAPLLLLLALCAGPASAALGGGEKPLDFLFSRCESPKWDDGIGGCLRDHLRVLLEILRPFITDGFGAGRDRVVLDPLSIEDIEDPLNERPRWRLTGVRATGLRNITLEEFSMTKSMIEVKINIPEVRMEAGVVLDFLPFVISVRQEVLKMRLILIAYWRAHDGEVTFDDIVGQFWSEGHSTTLRGLAGGPELPTWEPNFGLSGYIKGKKERGEGVSGFFKKKGGFFKWLFEGTAV